MHEHSNTFPSRRHGLAFIMDAIVFTILLSHHNMNSYVNHVTDKISCATNSLSFGLSSSFRINGPMGYVKYIYTYIFW